MINLPLKYPNTPVSFSPLPVKNASPQLSEGLRTLSTDVVSFKSSIKDDDWPVMLPIIIAGSVYMDLADLLEEKIAIFSQKKEYREVLEKHVSFIKRDAEVPGDIDKRTLSGYAVASVLRAEKHCKDILGSHPLLKGILDGFLTQEDVLSINHSLERLKKCKNDLKDHDPNIKRLLEVCEINRRLTLLLKAKASTIKNPRLKENLINLGSNVIGYSLGPKVNTNKDVKTYTADLAEDTLENCKKVLSLSQLNGYMSEADMSFLINLKNDAQLLLDEAQAEINPLKFLDKYSSTQENNKQSFWNRLFSRSTPPPKENEDIQLLKDLLIQE